jgi:hypothetical protein
MIDFARFWMEGNSPYEDEGPGATDTEVPPGVTAEEIREWEREYGVTLPEPLRTALGLRNGGFVRNTAIEVLPLDQIVPVADDFWEYTEIEEDEAPDRSLLFIFGNEMQGGATFLMNFNARGPEGAPSVYLDYHGESTYLVHDAIGDLFEAELASSAEPGVDWSEAESGLPVLARETIDLSSSYGGRSASEEQVLARQDEALILFTRLRSPDGEVLTRTTLPLPLDAGWAEVRPYRPAPIATFALHLQPAESDGIVETRSERNDDGRWKNSTGRGVPIYVTFESTDRDRLQSLRGQLLGTEGAARAQAKQDRQAALAEMLDGLPPEQRTAALLQAALTMKEETDRRFVAEFGDRGPVPPALAEAAEAMRLKLEQMAEQVRRKAAANPPDPETLRRIEGYLRDPDAE